MQARQSLNWTKQWYPVMGVQDLDQGRPHAFQLLGVSHLLDFLLSFLRTDWQSSYVQYSGLQIIMVPASVLCFVCLCLCSWRVKLPWHYAGKHLMLWHDRNASESPAWRCFEDSCPHRCQHSCSTHLIHADLRAAQLAMQPFSIVSV